MIINNPYAGKIDKGILCNNENGSLYVYNHRAEIILIDEKDYDLFMKYLWSVNQSGYLARGKHVNGKCVSVTFHREVTDFKFSITDHINRIKLDNRKTNLRSVSAQLNAANTSIRKSNTKGFIGVVYDARYEDYFGRIRVNGKSYYSKACKSIKEAAMLYLEMREEKYEKI